MRQAHTVQFLNKIPSLRLYHTLMYRLQRASYVSQNLIRFERS